MTDRRLAREFNGHVACTARALNGHAAGTAHAQQQLHEERANEQIILATPALLDLAGQGMQGLCNPCPPRHAGIFATPALYARPWRARACRDSSSPCPPGPGGPECAGIILATPALQALVAQGVQGFLQPLPSRQAGACRNSCNPCPPDPGRPGHSGICSTGAMSGHAGIGACGKPHSGIRLWSKMLIPARPGHSGICSTRALSGHVGIGSCGKPSKMLITARPGHSGICSTRAMSRHAGIGACGKPHSGIRLWSKMLITARPGHSGICSTRAMSGHAGIGACGRPHSGLRLWSKMLIPARPLTQWHSMGAMWHSMGAMWHSMGAISAWALSGTDIALH
jgi:hypothetical protein